MHTENRHIVRTTTTRLLAVLALLVATAPEVGAQYYWDGGTTNIGTDGNGVSLGTAGNWNTTLLNWDQGAGLAHVAWNNTGLYTAAFGGTAGTVTLTAPVTVGGLSFFSNSGYTIAAGASGLTFGATNNTISLVNQTTASTSSATISGTVAGNNVIFTSLNRNVASTLNFTGATAGGYTGTTTIGANTIVTLDGANNLNRNLLNTSGITLNGGAIDSGLIANNANANTNRINDSANWTVNSGSFTWGSSNAGGTYAETLGTVALTTGQMNFALKGNLSSGSQTLTLTGLTQAGTSAVTFSNAATAFNSSVGSATDVIRVTGAASTTAGQIIGPWATVGTAAANQTDYARYVSDGTHGYVIVAGTTLTAPGESGWGSATDAYQFAAGETLTADRTAAALRYTGGVNSLALAGFNLKTNGILNGGSGLLTVSGLGALTATGITGGNLYLNAGNNAITVSSAINDNGGAVTVVKNGAGNLTLSSTTSNYSGGTVVNAGTLTWTANTNLGLAGSRNITVNGTATLAGFDGTSLDALTVGSGGVATLSGLFNYTFASASGAGTIISQGGQNKNQSIGNAGSFTGNLALGYASNNLSALYTNPNLTFSSLGDAAGSAIQIYRTGGGTDSGQIGQVGLTGNTGSVTFNNRQIQLLPRTGTSNSALAGAALINNNATAANSWIINTPLLNLTERTTILHLAGTNTGANAFNGTIGDSQAGFALSLTKGSVGTWALGGANTYTGATTISGGTLAGIGANAFGSTSGISIAGTATLSLRGDSSTNFVRASDSASYSVTTSASGATINVGQATVAGTSLKTMSIGAIGTSSAAAAYQINFTGSNNTSLSVGAVTGAASTAIGTVTISNSIASTGILTLASYTSANTLGGETVTFTGAGNTTVTGAVTPSSTALALTKSAAGTLTLSGTNTYTGITTISAGVLEAAILDIGGNNSSIGKSSNAAASLVFSAPTATLRYTGSTDVTIDRGFTTSTAAGGGATIESSGTGTLSFDNAVAIAYQTSGQTRFLTLGGTNTGANTFGKVIANNGAGVTSLSKVGAGTWVLNQTNTYTGNTTISGGLLNTTQASALSGYNSPGRVIINGGTIGVHVGGAGWSTAEVNTMLSNATKTSGALGIDTTNGSLTQWTAFTTSNLGSTLGLTKLGANTLTLDQANTYNGTTTVSAGTLLVNNTTGSGTGAGPVAVNNGGTLGGTGAVGGATTVASGGTIRGGDATTVGTLTLANGLALSANSTVGVRINSSGTANPVSAGGSSTGSNNSLLSITGTTTIDSLTKFSINGLGASFNTNQSYSYTIMTGAGNQSTLSISSITTPGQFTFENFTNSDQFAFSVTGNSGGSVFLNIAPVPEPAAVVLIAVAALGLGQLVRRRKAIPAVKADTTVTSI